FDNDELVALVRQARDRRMVIGARSAPHAAPGEGSESEDHFAGLVGTSTVMIEVFRRIERAARSEAAVLVLGESGTGKELAARAIHSMSTRHRAPFVEVDCVAIPAQLLESELFGHERGAFTGAVERRRGRIEMSSGGTVFLDEIGEMPLEMQPKLLRFLQERQFFRVGGNQRVSVDVRVIAATNRDLRAEVAAKRFRDDLFHRLDVFPIEIPPLRERASDIPLLVHHFMNRSGGRPEQIDNEVLEVMMDYSWPGNVRELQNAVTHALIDAAGQPITLDKLPEKILEGRQAPASASEHSIDTLDLAENERWLIEQALREGQGNKTKAAVLLGITRRRLYSRMKLLGMDAGAEPADAD
ncbi:MAG: sigma-54 interaction domain-containing protein, partial [Planctomycetota bacterium]